MGCSNKDSIIKGINDINTKTLVNKRIFSKIPNTYKGFKLYKYCFFMITAQEVTGLNPVMVTS